MGVPDDIVFDAEPLIAHADAEPGSDVVATYLDAVAVGDVAGYVSCVNLAETRYTIARKYDRATADEYLEWLTDLGIEPVDGGEAWMAASEFVLEYDPALGDSFALATAEYAEATLLIGGDDNYDGVSDVSIKRFRDGAA